MVGPKRIQPFGQTSADRVLNGANNTLYLTVALAVASRRFLVDDSQHLAQAREAPLKL